MKHLRKHMVLYFAILNFIIGVVLSHHGEEHFIIFFYATSLWLLIIYLLSCEHKRYTAYLNTRLQAYSEMYDELEEKYNHLYLRVHELNEKNIALTKANFELRKH